MSKAGKKQAKSQARRANSKFASHNISMLDHHQRVGSKLIPPLAQMPKTQARILHMLQTGKPLRN